MRAQRGAADSLSAAAANGGARLYLGAIFGQTGRDGRIIRLGDVRCAPSRFTYRPSVLLPGARASVATLKGRENDEPSRGLGHGATQLERATAKLVTRGRYPSRRVLARQVIAEIRAAWCLTPAEARTVTALAAGRSTAEIAAAHDVSVHTVRTQLKRAMSKARVHTQSALVASVYSFVLARQRPRTRFGAASGGTIRTFHG